MATYTIYEIDFCGVYAPKKVEKHTGDEKSLKVRMKEMQLGWCEDEKPVVRTFEQNGRKYMEAQSDCDFAHVAVIGKVEGATK